MQYHYHRLSRSRSYYALFRATKAIQKPFVLSPPHRHGREPRDGGDEDDGGPLAGGEVREGLAGQQEGALDVDVEDLVPLILAALEREKSMRRKCFQVFFAIYCKATSVWCGSCAREKNLSTVTWRYKKGAFIPGRMDCTYLLRGMRSRLRTTMHESPPAMVHMDKNIKK